MVQHGFHWAVFNTSDLTDFAMLVFGLAGSVGVCTFQSVAVSFSSNLDEVIDSNRVCVWESEACVDM